MEGSYEYIE